MYMFVIYVFLLIKPLIVPVYRWSFGLLDRWCSSEHTSLIHHASNYGTSL